MERCKVELDIFSGRPNPCWTMTAAEALAFTDRLDGLPPAEPCPLFAGLGYRGLIVTLERPLAESTVRIQRGMAQIARGGGTDRLYFEAWGRALERWLLETGKRQLPADLLRILEREFS